MALEPQKASNKHCTITLATNPKSPKTRGESAHDKKENWFSYFLAVSPTRLSKTATSRQSLNMKRQAKQALLTTEEDTQHRESPQTIKQKEQKQSPTQRSFLPLSRQ